MSSFQGRRLKQKTDLRVECRDSSPVKDVYSKQFIPQSVFFILSFLSERRLPCKRNAREKRVFQTERDLKEGRPKERDAQRVVGKMVSCFHSLLEFPETYP